MSVSSAQARFDSTISRMDALLESKVREEDAAQRRADAARADEAREQARADAYRCREIGAMYDPAFMAHGQQTPQSVADEKPGRYRRRLYEHLRRKLPPGNELSDVRSDDIPAGQAFVNFENMIIEAAKAEGERPSVENLPDDGMVMRTRVDANTGTKYNEFFGKRSYIADMGRPGRRVAKIVDRRTGQAIWQAR
jgi:hypothetical protein